MASAISKKRKWIIGIMVGFLFIIIVTVFVVYRNLNLLLTNALQSNFQSGLLSAAYNLSFENLQVNPLLGNIAVYNVKLTPKENLPAEYAYINSTMELTTDKLLLKKVEILKLLRKKELVLSVIEIQKPVIELILSGDNYIFFPIIKSEEKKSEREKSEKKSLKAFGLEQFLLDHAQLHVLNKKKVREFFIDDLRIDIRELLLDWNPGNNILTNAFLGLSIGTAKGSLHEGPFAHFSFENFSVAIDSFEMQSFVDTTIYAFHDFHTKIYSVDANTKDSIAHLTLDSLGISYSGRSLELNNVQYKLNISDAEMQKKFTYQTAHFSSSVNQIKLYGFNFDSLMHSNQILMDSVIVSNVNANIYKDKTKPLNTGKFPEYLAQQIQSVKIPFHIESVIVRDANIISKEKLPSGVTAVVNVNRLAGKLSNVTNDSTDGDLLLHGTGYIDNRVFFSADIAFNYDAPQFSYTSTFNKFNLTDLNPVIQQFAPVNIISGVVDKIYLTGLAHQTYATGSMEFLYHNLKLDIDLEDKAKWLNSVISFAANTYIKENNPESEGLPPHIGNYRVERNMHKEFINVVLISAFTGLKETMVQSKEAKKDYKKAKKESKDK